MLLTTTLTDDLMLPIPREALEAAGWRPGQLFEIDVDGCNVSIRPTTPAQFQYALESEAELDAELAKLGGPKPLKDMTREDLFGIMAGVEVEDFVRDRSDRY